MATSTTTVTITDAWHDGKRQWVLGTILINAGDYLAGGLIVNLQTSKIKSSRIPKLGSMSVRGRSGFIYAYVPGTTLANGKLMVFAETTVATNQPLLEYTNTAASAALLADIIEFSGSFQALR